MVNAQTWLNEKFPTRESKEKVKKLYIHNDQGVNKNNDRDYYFYLTELEGELNFNEFINLEYLDIHGSSSNAALYQKLTNLNLNNCSKLKSLGLYYNNCQLVIEKNNTLDNLYLSNIDNTEFHFSEQLSNLKSLNISDCPKLARISNLDKLVNLHSFSLQRCPNLVDLSELNKLANLTNINIQGSKLTNLELTGLNNLTSLTIYNNPQLISLNLTDLSKLNSLSLCYSYYNYGNPQLTNLNLTKLNNLTSLLVDNHPRLVNLKLTQLDNLDSLHLNNYASNSCPQLSKIEGLEQLEKLNTLTLKNCPQLPQPEFKLMNPLRSLTISDCSKFTCQPEDFPDKLVSLNISKQKFSAYDLERIPGKENLTDLTFSRCSALKELKNLDKSTKLTKLTVESCANLESVEGLEKLAKLGKFSYKDCPKLQIFTTFDQWKKERDEKTEKVKKQQEHVSNLEQKTNKIRKEFEEKIKNLEAQKQLTENEKNILQKLKELFSAFDNQLDQTNIKRIEEILSEYKNLDFTNTPNLPADFKLKNENLSVYLDSSINYYYEWQSAKEEAEQLRKDIQQERNKNKEEIAKLEQEIANLNSQEQKKQLAEITHLQEELKLAQDQAKELENNLRITIQTSEKATQTNSDWEEELRQKDLKIEELKQQLAKQNRLSIKTRQINPSLEDSSWANMVQRPTESGSPISPSQIRAREKQKQQEQLAQIQTNLPSKK